MKEIMAVVRMNKINATKKALIDAGVSSMTAFECLGRGKGLVSMDLLKGAEEGHEEAIAQLGEGSRLRPKRALFVVVPDKLVQKTVDTIIDANQTGKPGDGKIWVQPTEDAISVRTSEHGNAVLDEF
ncbi:MAG: P-II family nitrogen regulator [Desulfobacter sp.]|jgi:nitrogen regulatory protein PII 2|uniref:P-II family nitrogen regulator n=1 Tax=uncultured Desulfobacter sp. TaxID=240139 RepID=UPI0029C62B49|nr:P-II family nitrogen regulator [uncultured Desulfobacter sp.]MCW8801181.1 P-II family nitrogen regulator [Desulfobacter sp.]